MIRLENLAIERGGKTLFRGIDLHLAAGEKAVITGPSGCGKTSVLMAVMGIFAPAAGRITVDGLEVEPGSIAAVRRRIAFISQEPILGTENVDEALNLPFNFKANRDAKPARKDIDSVLERLRLDRSTIGKASKKISAGEKQRIAIARALLLGKSIFLVDEATSALDPESKDAVLEILFDSSFTILSVSHDRHWIDRCRKVLRAEDSKIVAV